MYKFKGAIGEISWHTIHESLKFLCDDLKIIWVSENFFYFTRKFGINRKVATSGIQTVPQWRSWTRLTHCPCGFYWNHFDTISIIVFKYTIFRWRWQNTDGYKGETSVCLFRSFAKALHELEKGSWKNGKLASFRMKNPKFESSV